MKECSEDEERASSEEGRRKGMCGVLCREFKREMRYHNETRAHIYLVRERGFAVDQISTRT